MIRIPDKLRRPAEVEREELRKQLAEARAEIERQSRIIERMRTALSEVIRVADRATDEFDMARAALSAAERIEP